MALKSEQVKYAITMKKRSVLSEGRELLSETANLEELLSPIH